MYNAGVGDYCVELHGWSVKERPRAEQDSMCCWYCVCWWYKKREGEWNGVVGDTMCVLDISRYLAHTVMSVYGSESLPIF